ncbi:MAG: VanW family protein [Lachnospiraceae bacterium]|nr:VanW family protein [Lachnospiraceae bacterium]
MSKKIILFAVLFIATVGLAFNSEATADSIKKGVSIDKIDVGGMTKEEAKKAVDKLVGDIQKTQVHILVNKKKINISIGQLGYEWINTDVVDDAVEIGKKGNVVSRYKDSLDIDHKGKKYNIEMNIKEEDITSKIQKVCEDYKLNVKAKNATLKFNNTGFTVVPEQTGVKVDYDKTAKSIYKAITDKWDGKSEIDIEAQTEIDKPEFTEDDFAMISDKAMGTYTTTFSTGGSFTNRNKNIQNGARLLDGIVLYPGEKYSLNEHLEPWTEENGYFPAGTYVDGQVEDSLGGGICQVSSTLYNALLRAEMEIVERYPHSMSVGYVPLAADAALAGDYKDLKFKNNTDAPIFIRSIYENGALTFKVYGHETRNANRKIEFISETVSTTPIKTEVKKDSSRSESYSETVSSGHVGYVAKLWKKVYEDGKEVSKELVNTSTYRMTPKKVVQGTKKAKDDKDKDDKDDEDKDTEKKTDTDKKTDTEKKTDTDKKTDTEKKSDDSVSKPSSEPAAEAPADNKKEEPAAEDAGE